MLLIAKALRSVPSAKEENFSSHKETLLPFFETVWEALQGGEEFEQEWLNQWVREMKTIGS